jgi:pimeloyl-ACP methyl ester carboxylesterase
MLLGANGIHQHVQRLPPATTPPGRGGRPVGVFVHGLGTDSLASHYFTVAGPLAEAGFDVVMYDLRGHGRTDRPPTGYHLSDFITDLDALLAGLSVEGQVHLVGNSFGGTIAFSYALHRPDGVASVVLIESEPATESWAVKLADLLGQAHGRLSEGDAIAWISQEHGAQTSRLARAAGQTLRATTMATDIPAGPVLRRRRCARHGCRCWRSTAASPTWSVSAPSCATSWRTARSRWCPSRSTRCWSPRRPRCTSCWCPG